MDVSLRLRNARRALGITQAEMAHRAGTAQPAIAAYESGAKTPRQDTLLRILRRAGFRPSSLLREHRDDILRIAASHKASNVRVFGSVARGDDGPQSDIDFLVTLAPEASLLDQAALLVDLTELLGLDVDVISDDALVQPRHRSILRDAVPV